MPLDIDKQPFKPNPIPDNLSPDDAVFYLKLTNEIFTSHDAFFDRYLYCNSCVWTCSKTGKSGLTYKEALDSELEQELTKKVKKKKGKRDHSSIEDGSDQTNGPSNNTEGGEPIKKKKKKYPYDPKKYSMPVPEGFDPSLLTPTGKIDGRKLKSKKNKQLAEELLACQPPPPESNGRKGKKKKDDDGKKKEDEAKRKEEEAKRKEEEAKRKAQQQAELAKERELEAKRKKEAAALARQQERQKKEEERKKMAAFLQSWEKKCEDLERDDLRRLPQPVPLSCEIPEKLFGDAVFILESLFNLHELYELSSVFPEGISYDTLEEMLIDKQVDGPLSTVIKFLLKTIFETQTKSNGFGLDDDTTRSAPVADLKQESVVSKSSNAKSRSIENEGEHDHETNGSEADEDEDNEDKDVNMNDLIGSAIKAAQEVKLSLSKPLAEMELTSENVTEILRIHFLQSGSFPKGRTIYNGWYSSREDPGLWLCMQEPDLIKKLSEVSIFDLEIEERIKILHTLVYQLFSFIKTRLYIESASDNLTELRKQYRREAADFARWDRENYVSKANQENLVDYEDYQRERAIRYDELNQSLLSIRQSLRQTQSVYGIHPIGRDRAYRRYWIFQSLPGLFVEQDDEFLGRCLPNPTPLESTYKKLFNKDNPLMHQNESDLIRTRAPGCVTSSTGANSPESGNAGDNNDDETHEKETVYQETNGDQSHEDHQQANSDRLSDDAHDEHDDHQDNEPPGFTEEMNYCTGDETTCAIHGAKRISQPRWWFYHTPEQIDGLVESLNKRGYRESKLHDVLAMESSILKPYVSQCPAYKLNKTILEQSGIRRSRRLRTKGSKRRGKKYDGE